MSRILVVEDEAHIAKGLRFNLEAEGHSVEVVENGEDALARLLAGNEGFDELVREVMLAGKDGFAVASELRAAQNFIPILMLTARGRPEDVLQGFEAGADDYLPKPFNLDILIARIGGLLRRTSWGQNQNAATPDDAKDIFTFGGKTADFQRLQLRSGDQLYQLTLMESVLLQYLVRHNGRPVSRKELLEEVWGLHEDTDTRAIDRFIVRLRRYIEKEPANPRHLLTVRGLGYEFVAEPKS